MNSLRQEAVDLLYPLFHRANSIEYLHKPLWNTCLGCYDQFAFTKGVLESMFADLSTENDICNAKNSMYVHVDYTLFKYVDVPELMNQHDDARYLRTPVGNDLYDVRPESDIQTYLSHKNHWIANTIFLK